MSYNKKRTITIDPECVNNAAVILHEMIHAYISLFKGDRIVVYKDCLVLCLYKKLIEKIHDLDERIVQHAHAIKQEDFYGHGEHGLLFFLKSLDLDLGLSFHLALCAATDGLR